jgi:hypothetical protein
MRCATNSLDWYATSFVVTASRLDQPERTRPSEFVTIDVAGKLHGHLEDDVFHEGKMFLDQRRQLDIHQAHTHSGLHPRSAGSSASSPLFVVALVHHPGGLSIAIRGPPPPTFSLRKVSAGSTTIFSDSPRFLRRRP